MSEIANVEKAIIEALEQGDAAAAAACYTEDAVLMPPHRPWVEGRAAVQEHFQQMLGRFRIQISSTIDEEVTAGDWAYARTRLHQKVAPKAGGKAVEVKGKALIIARRDADGTWRYHRDIFNTDQPPIMGGGLLGGLLARLLGRRK